MAKKNKGDLISHHIFLFPFKWECSIPSGTGFENRHQLNAISPLIGSDWIKTSFDLNTVLRRNEYNYFYDFVREVLYDLDDSPLDHDKENDGYLDHFYYKPAENNGSTYTISIPKCKHLHFSPEKNEWGRNSGSSEEVETKEYTLQIDSILLHMYSTGVGILSFHLLNHEYPNPEDILRINQYGRRIYPPFFAVPHEHAGLQAAHEYKNFTEGLNGIKGGELAGFIRIQSPDKEPFLEDFSQFQKDEYKVQSFALPGFISGLFPPVIFTNQRQKSRSLFVSPILDDRMFVICWYGNDQLAQSMGKAPRGKTPSYRYSQNQFWYEYCFVDNPDGKSCQHDLMAQQKLEAVTDARWINYATLFGVTSYSFVAITSSLSRLRGYNAAFLVNHMQTLYYKMAEIVLMQKACLLKFSDEITRLSNIKKPEELAKQANELYQHYLRFINKIYFREVTAQDQGIELYNLLQQQLRVERDVQGLGQEMSELHNYVMLQEQMKQQETAALQQETAERLTKLATYFLPASLMCALFGLSTIGENFQFCGGPPDWVFWISLMFIVLGSFIGFLIINKVLNKKK